MGSQVVSQPQHNFKMRPSTLCLPLLSLLLVAFNLPSSNSTFAITVASAAGTTLLSLTAAQVTTLAALGVLAKVGGIGAGLLLARNRSRGKRQSDQEKITLEVHVRVMVSEDLEHVPVQFHLLRTGSGTDGDLDELLVLLHTSMVNDGMWVHGGSLGSDVLLAEL